MGPTRLDLEGGMIRKVEPLEGDTEGLDFVAPGLVDLQINGYGGINFSDRTLEADRVVEILPSLWALGVTQILPTLITQTREVLMRNFQILEQARAADGFFKKTAVGYHLEGPYLSEGPSQGAHRPDLMKDPDWEEFSDFQEAAGGNIRIITLAPERPGALPFIEKAVEAGVLVSLSHTDAEPEVIHRAVEAGASMNTHLGNGCPQMIDRHHAPLWAQLSNPALASGLICDGFHLMADFVRIACRLKAPGKLFLVSDAVHLAGLPPGDYDIAGKPITLLESGKIITGNQGSLAGASLPLVENVAIFMRMTGASLEEALPLASTVPATWIPSDSLCRKLEPAQPANLIVFQWREEKLWIVETFLQGERVFSKED